MNAAARTPACPSFLPPAAEAADAAQPAEPSLQEGAGGGGHANKRQRVDDAQPAAQQHEAREEGNGRDKGSAETGSTERVPPCVELVEDAIPWDAADPEANAGNTGGSPPSSDREDALNASNAESHSLEDTAVAGVVDASDDEQERDMPPNRAKRRAEDSAVLLPA